MVDAGQIRNLRIRGILPDIDYRAFLPKARNQNPFSACAAFASAHIHEFARFRKTGAWPAKPYSSPGYLWYGFRSTTCTTHTAGGLPLKDTDEGSYFPDYGNKLVAPGTCSEDSFPFSYSKTNYAGSPDHYDTPLFKPPTGTPEKLFKSHRTLSSDSDEWIAELFNGNLLMLRVDKYPSTFFNRPGDGFFDDLLPAANGGHAMVIVGFLNKMKGKPVFIVRNSWGTGWKDKGYCYYTVDCLQRCIRDKPTVFEYDFSPKPLPGIPVLPSLPPPVVPPVVPSVVPPPVVPPVVPPVASSGKYTKRWWLFKDKKQFDMAVSGNLSPTQLQARGIGAPLDAGEVKVDGNTPFDDIATTIPLPVGQVVGLGACITAFASFWKWDEYEIGKGKIKLKMVTPSSKTTRNEGDATPQPVAARIDGSDPEYDFIVAVYTDDASQKLASATIFTKTKAAANTDTPMGNFDFTKMVPVAGGAAAQLKAGDYLIALLARRVGTTPLTAPANLKTLPAEFAIAKPETEKLEIKPPGKPKHAPVIKTVPAAKGDKDYLGQVTGPADTYKYQWVFLNVDAATSKLATSNESPVAPRIITMGITAVACPGGSTPAAADFTNAGSDFDALVNNKVKAIALAVQSSAGAWAWAVVDFAGTIAKKNYLVVRVINQDIASSAPFNYGGMTAAKQLVTSVGCGLMADKDIELVDVATGTVIDTQRGQAAARCRVIFTITDIAKAYLVRIKGEPFSVSDNTLFSRPGYGAPPNTPITCVAGVNYATINYKKGGGGGGKDLLFVRIIDAVKARGKGYTNATPAATLYASPTSGYDVDSVIGLFRDGDTTPLQTAYVTGASGCQAVFNLPNTTDRYRVLMQGAGFSASDNLEFARPGITAPGLPITVATGVNFASIHWEKGVKPPPVGNKLFVRIIDAAAARAKGYDQNTPASTLYASVTSGYTADSVVELYKDGEAMPLQSLNASGVSYCQAVFDLPNLTDKYKVIMRSTGYSASDNSMFARPGHNAPGLPISVVSGPNFATIHWEKSSGANYSAVIDLVPLARGDTELIGHADPHTIASPFSFVWFLVTDRARAQALVAADAIPTDPGWASCTWRPRLLMGSVPNSATNMQITGPLYEDLIKNKVIAAALGIRSGAGPWKWAMQDLGMPGSKTEILYPQRDAPDADAVRVEGDPTILNLSGRISGSQPQYDYIFGIYDSAGKLVVWIQPEIARAPGAIITRPLNLANCLDASKALRALPAGDYTAYLWAQPSGRGAPGKIPAAPADLASVPASFYSPATRKLQVTPGTGKSVAITATLSKNLATVDEVLTLTVGVTSNGALAPGQRATAVIRNHTLGIVDRTIPLITGPAGTIAVPVTQNNAGIFEINVLLDADHNVHADTACYFLYKPVITSLESDRANPDQADLTPDVQPRRSPGTVPIICQVMPAGDGSWRGSGLIRNGQALKVPLVFPPLVRVSELDLAVFTQEATLVMATGAYDQRALEAAGYIIYERWTVNSQQQKLLPPANTPALPRALPAGTSLELVMTAPQTNAVINAGELISVNGIVRGIQSVKVNWVVQMTHPDLSATSVQPAQGEAGVITAQLATQGLAPGPYHIHITAFEANNGRHAQISIPVMVSPASGQRQSVIQQPEQEARQLSSLWDDERKIIDQIEGELTRLNIFIDTMSKERIFAAQTQGVEGLKKLAASFHASFLALDSGIMHSPVGHPVFSAAVKERKKEEEAYLAAIVGPLLKSGQAADRAKGKQLQKETQKLFDSRDRLLNEAKQKLDRVAVILLGENMAKQDAKVSRTASGAAKGSIEARLLALAQNGTTVPEMHKGINNIIDAFEEGKKILDESKSKIREIIQDNAAIEERLGFLAKSN